MTSDLLSDDYALDYKWDKSEPRPCKYCDCVIIETNTKGQSAWRTNDCKDEFKFICAGKRKTVYKNRLVRGNIIFYK